MTTLPQAGTVWLDRRPGAITTELRDEWRRLVEVTEANEGFVHGVSFWQTRQADLSWADAVGPGARRKTRVRTHLFTAQFAELRDGAR